MSRFVAVLSILVLFVAYSCNLQEKRAEKCRKWGVCGVKDSISYLESIKIDTIITDNSEMWLDMLFMCDSSGAVLTKSVNNLETENANLKIKLKDNRLFLYVSQPNDTIYISGKNITEYREKTKIIKEQYIPFWNKFCTYGFYVSVGGFIVLILIKRIF